MECNGMEWNGMEGKGMEWNGMGWDGMEWNGVEWSGVESPLGHCWVTFHSDSLYLLWIFGLTEDIRIFLGLEIEWKHQNDHFPVI